MKATHATLLLALLAGCRSTAGYASEVSDLVTRGHYIEAVELAAEVAEKRPRDERAQAIHKKASVAFLLSQARGATFDDRDDEALAILDQALAMDPDEPMLLAWEEKIREKLGDRWFLRARDVHIQENLEAAVEAYEASLRYDPNHDESSQGLARALLQQNYHDGLSDTYYFDGLHALQDYQLDLSRSRFKYSSRYRPEDPKPQRRVSEVERMLARQRLAVAQTFEDDDLYAAAYNEYRITELLDPELRSAGDGRERMRVEVEARKFGDKANMAILRGEWEKGRELLEQGRELTVDQADLFDSLLADIDDSKAQALYDEALNLEYDFSYEAAIGVYERLLASREYFQDARTRKSTLEEYVERAGDLYGRAARTPPGEARVLLLREIESFWPEYRDVREQLTALNAGVK